MPRHLHFHFAPPLAPPSFFCVRVYEYTLFFVVSVRKKNKSDREDFRFFAFTFSYRDSVRLDVQRRAAYRWKAENLTFPTVCGTSLYVDFKGVKIDPKVRVKFYESLTVRGASGGGKVALHRHLHLHLHCHLHLYIFLNFYVFVSQRLHS